MKRDLLLEIGTEEVPAHVMPLLLSDLKRLAGDMLKEHRLTYDSLRTIGTPRRTALLVTGLAERQEDVRTETRGPSVAIAFDAEGNPTKAGAGFARGQGIEPSALIQRDGYVYASVHEKGAETAQLLAELLPELIRTIPLPNSMRWGDLDFRFIRPIRWIVALYGTEVVSFTLANVTSGNTSRGHRTLAPQDFVIASPADYEAACEKAYIIVDQERWRAMITEQIAETAKAAGGRAVEGRSRDGHGDGVHRTAGRHGVCLCPFGRGRKSGGGGYRRALPPALRRRCGAGNGAGPYFEPRR